MNAHKIGRTVRDDDIGNRVKGGQNVNSVGNTDWSGNSRQSGGRSRPSLVGVLWVVGLAAAIALSSWFLDHLDGAGAESPYRAFSSSSYWNTPLPEDAPRDPDSKKIISFIKEHSTTDFIRFAGAFSSGRWGNPIYWSDEDDPIYAIRNSCHYRQPPEFDAVRIPDGARPDPTPDSAMTIYDQSQGLVFGLHWAEYEESTGTWSACGGTVYYLDSNGLHGQLRRSDESRNTGHRGVPPPTYAVRYDEIQDGAINHVLKIAVPITKCAHVFPMVGDECGIRGANAPPEGARIRIKPSVDLSSLGLSAEALVVARALQTYGAVIGDQSGGPVSLKLENTVAEGRGHLWEGLLPPDALSPITLDDFEVIRLGYDPTRKN
jgi:hypothetical protein